MKRGNYINQIKDVMSKVAPQAEVILFGSRARGDAQPDSDIDLLILINKENLTYKEIKNITNPLYELELQDNYNVSISPLIYTRKQWHNRPFRTPFYINVMKEGIKIL
jgi:predicted nucleotidyltransferase